MEKKTVQDNMVVSLDYTVRLDNGQIVDTTEGREPLHYIQGTETILPSLEQAISGMQEGDTKEVTLSAAEAYGERMDVPQEWIPREIFPPEAPMQPGMAFRAQTEQGNLITLYVQQVEEERVLIDYNHPLAGEQLHFNVEVTGLRPATDEEIAHGHIHGDGGGHH